MRTAFFGGSFDPPHRGHVAIATAAADRLQLDRVLVAPVGKQPLKDHLAMADFTDRLAMVELAFASDPRCQASRLDAPHPHGAHNYTYETLATLQQQVQQQLEPSDPSAKLFCLLGADSFHTLAHWHRAPELIGLCDFILAARPGYSLEKLHSRLPPNARVANSLTAPGLSQVQLVSTNDESPLSRLYVMTDLEEDVSATALRHALASGDTAISDHMLAPAVADYICHHHLYNAALHC